MFIGCKSTRRKKERCAGSAKQDRTGDGTDGKRHRTSNARRNRKPDGQTGAAGEKRATKRENGTGGAEPIGRMARDETGKRAVTRVGNGRRNRRDGNAERATHEETGDETDGTAMSVDGLTTRRENGRLERKH